jgi:peptidoglycan/LPS O-acetylase OafA/YrhL
MTIAPVIGTSQSLDIPAGALSSMRPDTGKENTANQWSMPDRIPALDGIRGLACLMVLFHHYVTGLLLTFKITSAWYISALLAPFFSSGVDLFFVLSGFLIGGILIDNRSSPNYFKTFYIRRACRIFPVYYFLLFSFITVSIIKSLHPLPDLDRWLFANPMPIWSYATFTQSYTMAAAGDVGAFWLAITWSLSVEEQFYLIFPLLVRVFPARFIPHIAVTAILVAPTCRLFAEQVSFYTSYVLLPCRMDTLMFGVLAAYLVRQPPALAYLQRNTAILFLTLLGLAVPLLADSFGLVHTGTLKFSLRAAIYGIVILLVVIKPQGLLNRLFQLKFLLLTGLLSYAIYMYHQAVNGLIQGFVLHQEPHLSNINDLIATIFSIFIVYGVATASYFWLERPVRAYGSQFRY